MEVKCSGRDGKAFCSAARNGGTNNFDGKGILYKLVYKPAYKVTVLLQE
jgi:hypothetical protein